MTNKIIYTLRIYQELLERYGIMPIATIPNPHKSGFNAWVYAQTDEFMRAFVEITQGKD